MTYHACAADFRDAAARRTPDMNTTERLAACAALALAAGCNPPAAEEPAVPAPPLITAVRGDLATVNLGAADGVAPGARLAITRDGRLVGQMILEVVDPRESAGVLVLMHAPAKVGDRAVVVRESPGRAAGHPATWPLGKITAVKDNMASVNIGRRHGVRPGMKLLVTRGSRFLAYLRVEVVDGTEAAGLVTDRRFDPRVGDEVRQAP
jgi:hypothetical protein